MSCYQLSKKGSKRGSYGCKEQLLINKMTLQNCRRNKRNLSSAWIDYKKTFDSVPHSCIIKILKMFKIRPTVADFIIASMKKWKTTLHLNHITSEPWNQWRYREFRQKKENAPYQRVNALSEVRCRPKIFIKIIKRQSASSYCQLRMCFTRVPSWRVYILCSQLTSDVVVLSKVFCSLLSCRLSLLLAEAWYKLKLPKYKTTTIDLATYLKKSDDPLLKLVNQYEERRKSYSIKKYADKFKKELNVKEIARKNNESLIINKLAI